MKRPTAIFLILYFLAVLLPLGNFAYAEPVGNTIDINAPAGPGIFSSNIGDYITLNIGAETEFLQNKDLDSDGTTSSIEMDGSWTMVRLSATFCERIQPYFKIGLGGLGLKWKDVSGSYKAESDSDIAWGIGCRVFIWEFPRYEIKFTGSCSYRTLDSEVDTASISGKINSSLFEVDEWQCALGLSKEFVVPDYEDVVLVPYGGLKYSDCNARVRYLISDVKYSAGATGNNDIIGIFLGMDVLFEDIVALNLEGRFIDENSISTGLTVVF